MNVKIGAKIKSLRKRDDITQEKLADALGVTSQAVSKWESESSYPDIEYITPLANFFNVTIDYLFDHDTAEKKKRIDEHCERFDIHSRDMKPPQERVDMMRMVLAQFPAEEQLLFRLAKALYDKWGNYGWYTKLDENGCVCGDFERHKAYDSWDESAKIMEELLLTSTDDKVRNDCRWHLASIYGWVGEKDKVLAIAEKSCHIWQSKENLLASSIHDKDTILYEQKRLFLLLQLFRDSFMTVARSTKDNKLIDDSYSVMINLFKFVFSDGEFGVANLLMSLLYRDHSFALIFQERFDEAFEAMENEYAYAKAHDAYIAELREKGVMSYTSPFVNLIQDKSEDQYSAADQTLWILKWLRNEIEIGYERLHTDPRYAEFINKIENAL
ncbi:MAG: helix-turn-helix domain-containing protein [Firmicutes bacterium]|nr:helix-turn-helix domain-containing protein [Bacillota bacterium]